MKLAKKLLAVVLALAMVFGMVAISATASITDYYEYDKDTNPYAYKLALKTYKVDTETGEYTEITDGAVDAGDVVRVEIWAQTNFYTHIVQYAVMYSNTLFQATALDYTTYDYYDKPSTVSAAKVYELVAMDEEHAWSAEGTLDNPFYLNECVLSSAGAFIGKTASSNFATLKKHMPLSWKGTGTTAANYYSTEEALNYNYYMLATVQDTTYTIPGAGMAIILTELQPVMYFNLTVPEDAAAGTSGKISIDPETVANSENKLGSTFMARYDTDDGSGEADAAANNLQYIQFNALNAIKYADTYGADTTKYDRVVDVSDATITLTVGGSGGVDPTPTVDKTALKAAIDTVVDTTNCTSASVKAYTDALAAAQTVYDKDDATQTEVDSAKDALLAAISGLTKLDGCDYTALDEAIAAYEALTLADYTPASVEASNVEALYSAAKAVERDMTADEAGENQTKIDSAATALDTAIKALVKKADKTALAAKIAAAKSYTADNYTPDSWAEADLANVIEAAEVVNANANASDTDVTAAIASIDAAIAKLVAKADKSALKAAIDTVPTLDENTATEASWAAYTAALAAAQAVYEDAAAAQNVVDEAKTALVNAIEALTARELCDYTALDEALALTPAEEQGKYTVSSWKAYAAAKAAAEEIDRELINDKSGANQAAVDAAAQALTDAFNALEISKAAVTVVEADFSKYYKKGTLDYEFTVTGAPSKLRVAGEKGSTITLDRYSRNVKIVSYNAEGEVVDYAEEDPAYEVWTVALSLGEGDFTAWAKYGKIWEEFRYEFTVNFVDNTSKEVKFVAKEAGSDDEASKALVLTKGSAAEITVVAPETVAKVQLVFASGSTSTYTASNANVVDNGDGTCTWTINRLFKYEGTGSMALKLKDSRGWYEANTAAITTEITK